MFGVKINEFDNSDGKIATFNKIFPNTPLDLGDNVKYVEIGDINYTKNIWGTNVYERLIHTYNRNYEPVDTFVLDFGEENFYNNEDFLKAENVRFKWFAKDFDGNILAKAYSSRELAEKMGCHINVIKRRINDPIDDTFGSKYKFNVIRKEI
jgi:hypothetical protein